jgi:hypothetical protein
MTPPPKANRLKVSGSNFKQRLMLVAGGGIVLVLIMVILFGVILKPNTKYIDALLQVAATQQDIVDLTELGNENIQGQQLLNMSITISSVVTSHLAEVTNYINDSSFAKDSSKKITLLRDTDYETLLDDAKIDGTYDATYQTLLTNRLAIYRSNLQTAYQASSSQKLKTILNDAYNEINELNLSD